MSTWLFDLGNTRLKFAPLRGDGTIGAASALAHGEDAAWLSQLPEGEVACIATVSHRHGARLLDALAQRFTRLHLARTEPRLGGLTIAYAQPAHLGVDRFLALLARSGEGASLLVGIGTALTIDLMDAGGLHRGGRIAPSPQLMREALHARVAQLPPSGGGYATFAGDTAAALASGCEGAALALVAGSLDAARALLGESPTLVLHGGGARALRARLPPHLHQPDLVLHGLARWHALRIA